VSKVLDFQLCNHIATVYVYFQPCRKMNSDFNDMYQADTVATCDTAVLKSLGRNDVVTATEQLESDILLSIKKEDLVRLPIDFVGCLLG
jgi:hypothetical protein